MDSSDNQANLSSGALHEPFRADVSADDKMCIQPVTVAYVAGTGFCGSTLTSFVLNAQPQIFSPGEVGPSFRVQQHCPCSCGVMILRHCPFYAQVAARMQNQGLPLDLDRWGLRYRFSDEHYYVERVARRIFCDPRFESLHETLRVLAPSYRRFMERQDRRNEAFIRTALEVAGKSIFLDATKLHTRISELRRIPRINLRVVHLVRDPRGFCHSGRKRNRFPLPVLARQWVAVNQAIQQQVRALPPHSWIRVTYESLCSEPVATFAQLAQFCGAEQFEFPANYRTFPHHIIGNRMRQSSDGRTRVKLDQKWKTDLSMEELEVIAKLAGPLAREYGYTI